VRLLPTSPPFLRAALAGPPPAHRVVSDGPGADQPPYSISYTPAYSFTFFT
jgi:hypothetical protein